MTLHKDIPDCQYQNQIDYILCSQRWKISIQLAGEGNGNPLQYSGLENPEYRGAWWAAVHGVTQSQTRLKQLSSSSSIQLAKTRPETLTVAQIITYLLQN